MYLAGADICCCMSCANIETFCCIFGFISFQQSVPSSVVIHRTRPFGMKNGLWSVLQHADIANQHRVAAPRRPLLPEWSQRTQLLKAKLGPQSDVCSKQTTSRQCIRTGQQCSTIQSWLLAMSPVRSQFQFLLFQRSSKGTVLLHPCADRQ